MKRLLLIPVLVVLAVVQIMPTNQCARGGVTVPGDNGKPDAEFCPSPLGCVVAPPTDSLVFPMDEATTLRPIDPVTGEPAGTFGW